MCNSVDADEQTAKVTIYLNEDGSLHLKDALKTSKNVMHPVDDI